MGAQADQHRDRGHQGFFRRIRDGLSHAIYVRVRYFTPDEKGKTRRERNEAFNQPPGPHYADEIPEGGEHLWEWYHDISGRITRIKDGGVEPIPPSEYVAWQQWTGHIVYQWEREVLMAMDLAFCAEMREELKAYHERISPPPSPTKRK